MARIWNGTRWLGSTTRAGVPDSNESNPRRLRSEAGRVCTAVGFDWTAASDDYNSLAMHLVSPA